MNWIKKTLVLTVLSIVLLFAFKGETNTIAEIQHENSNSNFSNDSIHASAFIQPQVTNTFVVNHKVDSPVFIKWFDNFLFKIPDFKILKHLNTFLVQDINRCQNVSLLLFPFHYFW
ncbi:hypothetical protein [Flavobacterium sp.]|uniref:hypothetical protein n=1 Tax=Flavobacterium sp. TaxID=239 RepID=UPI002B4AC60F|nr:hypothetical protein [Flavobacterium sp.]HLF52073.1 hypothetical protein [Flavobacterium sp.]